ncbi:MAG: B12-binding domain-containing protein [Coriobacteriales bacterium]|jgi:methanogenic corrinoid protein MtbC1|nr:B12-binding domain-containing protein [Coriobacteriales bacterium]
MSKEELLALLGDAVADGDGDKAVDLAKEAFETGVDPMEVLNDGASKGLSIIGARYSSGDAYLPDLVGSGAAMSAVMDLIFAQTEGTASLDTQGVVIIGQSKGDIHDIGKNVVSALLAVNGFEVHDLGTDVSVKTFYEKALEHNADIIAMSSLLTTSLPFMDDMVRYVNDTGTRERFFCIVGGGPVTADFAESIGADGWGQSAFDCVELCKKLMARGNPGSGPTIKVDSQAEGRA